ncbi:MAG: MotA/TolQ/ExbB proton channel family protein [Pseudomonadota bacterium]
MDKGGPVLWAILAIAIVLWWLMLERFWFFGVEFRGLLDTQADRWSARAERTSWYASYQHKQVLSEIDCAMSVNMKVIPTLIALLPMFGLLGTVTGMIQVFDVMAAMGSGNPRAMANGVSAATIPTMAGMVVALAALPFATQLERRYRRNLRLLAEVITKE